MVKSANTKAKSRPAAKGRPLMSRKSVAAAVVGIASVINACSSPNPFERKRFADVQTPLKNAVVSVANQFADGPAGRVSAEGMQKIITAFPRANLCLKRVREILAERRAAKRDEFGRVDMSRNRKGRAPTKGASKFTKVTAKKLIEIDRKHHGVLTIREFQAEIPNQISVRAEI